VVVQFVDIGGIVGHHCLKFLFINHFFYKSFKSTSNSLFSFTEKSWILYFYAIFSVILILFLCLWNSVLFLCLKQCNVDPSCMLAIFYILYICYSIYFVCLLYIFCMFLMLFNFVLNVVLVCFPSFSATI
jgi:hypothetical protein